MTWWQIALTFVGIPAAIFVLITLVVFRFATARVPDGLAVAADVEAEGDEESPSAVDTEPQLAEPQPAEPDVQVDDE